MGVMEEGLRSAITWAMEKRQAGLSVSLYYDTGKMELAQMVREGNAKSAAMATPKGVEIWYGGEDAWM